MVATLRIRRGGEPHAERFPLSRAWALAGFDRHAAETWRRAGWRDPVEASAWLAASPRDGAGHLRAMSQAGYTPDQLDRVGRSVHAHVGAWTSATVGPPEGGMSEGRMRSAEANLALALLSTHPATGDVTLDLRD